MSCGAPPTHTDTYTNVYNWPIAESFPGTCKYSSKQHDSPTSHAGKIPRTGKAEKMHGLNVGMWNVIFVACARRMARSTSSFFPFECPPEAFKF